MDTRRAFIKKVASLTASAGIIGSIPDSIAKAASINPAVGSTYQDAEHIVVLMQENRSFDHCFGMLQGVRGFNDPRAIDLPNKNRVWLQTDGEGKTYVPFRLNINDTKSTWMGSLPHSWTDQVDAGNKGKHDKWLIAKKSGHEEYKHMPLTLGYYSREDIPFYYSLADAFTVCDQNFCSSLTGTTPNRLYLWTGTIRETPDTHAYANVRNENVDYDKQANWKTFPERLEENGISWKIYQNELSVGAGFEGEQDSWLGNFTDNPIEWFSKYHVKFSKAYREALPGEIDRLKKQIDEAKTAITNSGVNDALTRRLKELQEELLVSEYDLLHYTSDNWDKLTPFERQIHERAFVTNVNDPDYHKLVTMKYQDGNEAREVLLPAGDVLHQFRDDVKNKKLPSVSWLVAPENFSDHPGAPWYGAWYVSEVMDILTKDPEVWKKTIFILAYDENDGYFDHVPPFRVPDPAEKHAGKVSEGINTEIEFVTVAQDRLKKEEKNCRTSAIGLGYRVPLVIASPWSRGGSVCSEVFDHTSVLQFMETFLTKKTGKKIEETNISAWRRTICGDLTSSFKPYNGEKISFPLVVQKNAFIEGVHKAQFKEDPHGYHSLSQSDIASINDKPSANPLFPRQEKGIRSSCTLPYELYVDGSLDEARRNFIISLSSARHQFGDKTAGAPFTVYAPVLYKDDSMSAAEVSKSWAYAVKAGDKLSDTFALEAFDKTRYHLQAYGPNGFLREFKGDQNDPALSIEVAYQKSKSKKLTGNIEFTLRNKSANAIEITLSDKSYGAPASFKVIGGGKSLNVVMDLTRSFRWYDFIVEVKGAKAFGRRYCGRVENGEAGFTDPAMGAALT